jgi:hypothetical protein
MIIVAIEVALTSTHALTTGDTPEFTEILANQLFDNDSVASDDITSDYGKKFVRITLTSMQEVVEDALAMSMQAVEGALAEALAQMPFVSTKISSIEAKQLTAA